MKVLQTLKEMMSYELELGLKVLLLYFHVLSHVGQYYNDGNSFRCFLVLAV